VLLSYLQKAPLVLLSIIMAQAVSAHEFWLEPLDFEVESGSKIAAHIKVGQMLDGNTYAYYPTNFERFDVTVGETTSPVKGRFAQSPAFEQVADQSGLHILAYQSKPSRLRYDKRETFESFLKNEGIEWVLEAHKKRGLPELDFTEFYQRYAKSLIKVGDGAGNDRALGLPIEWVVETNPYTTENLEAVTAQLLYQDKPFSGSHVVVFNKLDGEVTRQTFTTDDEGRVVVPVAKGGLFLVNAVHMIEPTKEQTGGREAEWMSLWASTTYEIAGR